MVKKTLNTNRKSLTTYIAGKPCAVTHLAPSKSKIGVITGLCRFGNHELQQFYGFGAYKCTLQYYMVGLRVAEVNIPPLWGRTKEGDGFFNLKYKSQATLNCLSPTLTLPRGEGMNCTLKSRQFRMNSTSSCERSTCEAWERRLS